jgi:hypothetical protein
VAFWLVCVTLHDRLLFDFAIDKHRIPDGLLDNNVILLPRIFDLQGQDSTARAVTGTFDVVQRDVWGFAMRCTHDAHPPWQIEEIGW